MSLFGDLNLEEFATIYRVAVASYGKADPPAGFDALSMADLGLEGGDKTIFTSKNGRGKAIVTVSDGELIVGFRGSDKFNDVKDYDNISLSGKYYKQFAPLIEAVAEYKAEHDDLDVTFTGISLGGAVTNIIADRAANGKWNGAFDDAHFVGVSAPYLSGSRKSDVFNFGFQNDPVYHVIPGSWTAHVKEMATRNLFIYQQHKSFGDDNIGDRLGNHQPSHVGDLLKALDGLTVADGRLLANVLKPNSYVLLDDAKGSVNAGQLRHNGDSVLTVLGQDRGDKLFGATSNNGGSDRERMFGLGGNDELRGRGGQDELYGGNGSDVLNGGRNADLMFGDNGDDLIFLEDHGDRAEGGEGSDRFRLADIPPLKSNDPARVFIDDFVLGEDTIVLTHIDGNLNKKGDQWLHFDAYYKSGVSPDSAELQALEAGYVSDRTPGSVTIFEDGNGRTLVIVNLDNDRYLELEIVVQGEWGPEMRSDLVL